MNEYQIFLLKARNASENDEMVALVNGKWFLLKEQKNGGAYPVRMTFIIPDDRLGICFFNRDVEVLSAESTRQLLALYQLIK